MKDLFRRNSFAIVVVLVVGAAGPHRALARLGETFAECEARYGPGKRSDVPTNFLDGPNFEFHKDGVRVRAAFIGTKVESIGYDFPAVPTASQLDDLLEKNAQGSKWTETRGTDFRQWHRADGAYAEIQLQGYTLRIWSEKWIAAKETAHREYERYRRERERREVEKKQRMTDGL